MECILCFFEKLKMTSLEINDEWCCHFSLIQAIKSHFDVIIYQNIILCSISCVYIYYYFIIVVVVLLWDLDMFSGLELLGSSDPLISAF